jgi:uncharacterized protein (TIGR03086 family)
VTPDAHALLGRATDEFARRLSGIGPGQWATATPCTDWTVRDLVDHVTGGNRFAVALLDGDSLEDAFLAALAPGFGDDVAGDFADAAAAQLDAFAAPGALGRICHHPRGDVPGSVFLGMRVGDLTLHAWDLARALGMDERLDDDLVAASWACYQHAAPETATAGWFGEGPSGLLADDAPLQARLLDLTGRRP